MTDDEDKLVEIEHVNMEKAGRTMRELLAPKMYESIMKPSPLVEMMLAQQPKVKLTSWMRFKARVHNAIVDFRIWLSKKIWYWSDEDY